MEEALLSVWQDLVVRLALSQLWLFWLAPVVGAVSAGVVYRCLAAEEAEEEIAHEVEAALA